MNINIDDVLDDSDIQERLKERALNVIYEAVDYQMQQAVRNQVEVLINRDIEKIVSDVLSGEINLDDGWGKKEHYNSFEELYKQELHKALTSYRIEGVAKKHVEAIIAGKIAEHVKVLSAKLTEMALPKPDTTTEA